MWDLGAVCARAVPADDLDVTRDLKMEQPGHVGRVGLARLGGDGQQDQQVGAISGEVSDGERAVGGGGDGNGVIDDGGVADALGQGITRGRADTG